MHGGRGSKIGLLKSAAATAVGDGGAVYAAGGFLAVGDTLKSSGPLALLNSDGTVASEYSSLVGFNLVVNSVVFQADGKLVAGGTFAAYDGVSRNRIARINADGSLDTGFTLGNGTGFNNNVNAIAIQPDGKILVGGLFTSYGGTPLQNRIIRLNADGSRDSSFNSGGGGFNNNVNTIAVRSDGKIVVGGAFTTYNGVSQLRIILLNSNGTVDSAFSSVGSGFNAGVNWLAIQSDGKIVVCGSFASYNGSACNRIARLNTNGSIDTGFSTTGTGFDVTVSRVEVQGDGKIVVTGPFTNYDGVSRNGIARLNSNGTLDTSFVVGTGFTPLVVTGLAIQADGKLLIGGQFQSYNGTSVALLTRLTSSGEIDAGFENPILRGQSCVVVAIGGEGKIAIGGNFTSLGGTDASGLARFSSTDGSPDVGFNVGTGTARVAARAVALQVAGKSIIGGDFTSYNGTACGRIARILNNGAIDASFDGGVGFNGGVTAIGIQGDGRIVVGGSFSTYNAVSRVRLARLNSDGSLDSSFSVGTGVSGPVEKLAIQADGKIIVVGNFTLYNETARNRITRVNSDGTLDSSFVVGTGFNSITHSVAIQSDNKIVVGGVFTSYNGTPCSGIARLNPDGSFDSGFSIGTGFTPLITTAQVAIQNDGKIVVGGSFTAYNGISVIRIARLNTDGSVDSSFTSGGGFDAVVTALACQSDGKILVGGDFLTYQGVACIRHCRLNTDGTRDSSYDARASGRVSAIAVE